MVLSKSKPWNVGGVIAAERAQQREDVVGASRQKSKRSYQKSLLGRVLEAG
jgi:hypothetical protein